MEEVKADYQESTNSLPSKEGRLTVLPVPLLHETEGPDYGDLDRCQWEVCDRERNWADQQHVQNREHDITDLALGTFSDVLLKHLAVHFVPQAGFQWTNIANYDNFYLHWNCILNMMLRPVHNPPGLSFEREGGRLKSSQAMVSTFLRLHCEMTFFVLNSRWENNIKDPMNPLQKVSIQTLHYKPSLICMRLDKNFDMEKKI